MSITLAQLKEQARQRADMEDSHFVEDEELLTYINSSIAELHDLLVSAYNDYYVETFNITTIADTDSYDLPSDFYKLKGVDVLLSANNYFSMRPFNFNERNLNQNGAWSVLGSPALRYRLVGNQIKFSPMPDSANTIKIWYVPTAQKLVDDADIFKDLNQYSEYVVVDAAIKMLAKEESDVSILASQKMDLRKRIENMAANRDVEQPESISDIYAENDEFWISRS